MSDEEMFENGEFVGDDSNEFYQNNLNSHDDEYFENFEKADKMDDDDLAEQAEFDRLDEIDEKRHQSQIDAFKKHTDFYDRQIQYIKTRNEMAQECVEKMEKQFSFNF